MVAFWIKTRVLNRESKRNAIASDFFGFYEVLEKGQEKRKRNGKKGKTGLNACMRNACTGVYVMRMRANSINGKESQENFVEKIFKTFVDSVCRIVYHV